MPVVLAGASVDGNGVESRFPRPGLFLSLRLLRFQVAASSPYSCRRGRQAFRYGVPHISLGKTGQRRAGRSASPHLLRRRWNALCGYTPSCWLRQFQVKPAASALKRGVAVRQAWAPNRRVEREPPLRHLMRCVLVVTGLPFGALPRLCANLVVDDRNIIQSVLHVSCGRRQQGNCSDRRAGSKRAHSAASLPAAAMSSWLHPARALDACGLVGP